LLKPSIRSCLTFPPESVHNHISFPELTYAKVASSSRVNSMAAANRYVAGATDQRPSHDRAVVVADRAMMAELQKLRRKAVVLSAVHAITVHHPKEVAYELHRQLCFPLWNIMASTHKLENLLVHFDYPDQRDEAIRVHSLQVGSVVYLIQPW
jgi:hypothetical protein